MLVFSADPAVVKRRVWEIQNHMDGHNIILLYTIILYMTYCVNKMLNNI